MRHFTALFPALGPSTRCCYGRRVFEIKQLVPELWCSDFAASLRFYVDVLGFTVAQRRDEDAHAYLSLGDAQIMIANWDQDGTWEPAPLEQPFGRGINLQVLVDDVRSLRQRLTQAEVEPFVELYTKSYWRTDVMDERTEFAVLDPDGYLLRFTQVESQTQID